MHKFFSLDDFTTRNIEFINTPKNGYFDYKIKSLHKSKIGSLKKGWPYVFVSLMLIATNVALIVGFSTTCNILMQHRGFSKKCFCLFVCAGPRSYKCIL